MSLVELKEVKRHRYWSCQAMGLARKDEAAGIFSTYSGINSSRILRGGSANVPGPHLKFPSYEKQTFVLPTISFGFGGASVRNPKTSLPNPTKQFMHEANEPTATALSTGAGWLRLVTAKNVFSGPKRH